MTTKKHSATLLILMLFGLSGLVHAQMSTTIKASVPFDFVANARTIPAGECSVEVVVSKGTTRLSISSGKQHIYILSALPNGDMATSKQTSLVFHKYGDLYFLAGIKRAGGIGYELPAGRLEAELQAQNVTGEVFTLLASAK